MDANNRHCPADNEVFWGVNPDVWGCTVVDASWFRINAALSSLVEGVSVLVIPLSSEVDCVDLESEDVVFAAAECCSFGK